MFDKAQTRPVPGPHGARTIIALYLLYLLVSAANLVRLESCKFNEDGQAVHEDCYALRRVSNELQAAAEAVIADATARRDK